MDCSLPPLLLLLFIISASVQLNPATSIPSASPSPSPYLSPSLFSLNYQNMLKTFKIFIYDYHQTHEFSSFNTTTESLFHTSLLNSPFTTPNGDQANLFYLYFPPNSSYKSISRKIKNLRIEFPFWNRTLGADHFYISCSGVAYESDRNLVELKKNSIKVSCFRPPVEEGRFRFIPHKDITLPPLFSENSIDAVTRISRKKYLGFLRYRNHPDIGFIRELSNDADFLIESEPSNNDEVLLFNSKFCLFFYGDILVSSIGEALRYGCMPVVITDRSISLDLPFMDLLRWMEIAVFVEAKGGVKEVKNVLRGTCGEDYEKMREMGMMAGKHFVWNSESPQPYDAFHMVLYQLWMRRHVIRYTPF